jgi:hypothetical protein
MKKFGTPIGAGPGSDSEKVGLLAAGTPLPVGSVTFFLCLACVGALGAVEVCCGCEDFFCCLVGLVGWGVVELRLDEVVVELEPEVEVELEVEEDEDELPVLVLPELLVLVDVVVVVVELWDGTHDSLSDTTVPVIGRPIAEIGVPGGTLTLKVSVCPPTRVTRTVQASAEALGMAATAMAIVIAAASARTNHSFRLFSNAARLLRNHAVRRSIDCSHDATWMGKLLTGPGLCNAEPTRPVDAEPMRATGHIMPRLRRPHATARAPATVRRRQSGRSREPSP